MRLLSDNPATQDTLGFGQMATVLHTVIRETPYRPFTIGIFGEWGSGKSTLMKLIQTSLQRDSVKTVWFNAWKYDTKEVIWNALIQEIFYTMQHDSEIQNRTNAEKFKKDVAHAAAELAKYAAKVVTRFIPGGTIKEEDVDAVLEALRPPSANDALFDFINHFESTFDQLVKDYVGNPNGYLVIFIDDLDRCLPGNAIAVMEALKLYLDRANCVFVIGAERSIIEEGIKERYKDNPRLSGKDYLEKIIQLPFIVRRADAENALSLLEPYEKTLPYRDDPALRALIVQGTECNPRRIKRFINTFWVLTEIAGALTREQRRLLAKVLFIQMRFPTLHNALVEDLELAARLTDVWSRPQNERDKFINDSAAPIKLFYADTELMSFLEKTRDIPCDAEKIEACVMLTKGQTAVGTGGLSGT
jgi:ABC-type oligopeptide transport system ATPase subunit